MVRTHATVSVLLVADITKSFLLGCHVWDNPTFPF